MTTIQIEVEFESLDCHSFMAYYNFMPLALSPEDYKRAEKVLKDEAEDIEAERKQI